MAKTSKPVKTNNRYETDLQNYEWHKSSMVRWPIHHLFQCKNSVASNVASAKLKTELFFHTNVVELWISLLYDPESLHGFKRNWSNLWKTYPLAVTGCIDTVSPQDVYALKNTWSWQKD